MALFLVIRGGIQCNGWVWGRRHTGPISLTDTHLEREQTDHHQNRRRWKGLLPETLKRLADAVVWRRSEYQSMRSACVLRHRVTHYTVCRLG